MWILSAALRRMTAINVCYDDSSVFSHSLRSRQTAKKNSSGKIYYISSTNLPMRVIAFLKLGHSTSDGT